MSYVFFSCLSSPFQLNVQSVVTWQLIPMVLVRNQIRNMLGGETGKITFGKLSKNLGNSIKNNSKLVYCVRNVMAHGDAREGKWRGNWRMEWVASTLTRPRNMVYPPLLTLMRTPRLPAVDWTDCPADLNGLVRLGERRNVVSARVPTGSARAVLSGKEKYKKDGVGLQAVQGK